ncbi:MAG: xylulokinase [Pseudomonadota bacterium]
MSLFLGIDLGTSSVKAVVVDADGHVRAEAVSDPIPLSRPKPGWSEQDPEDWWTAASQAVLDLPADLRAGVKAIGLSGQMHGAVCLDANDTIIRPTILWNDGRSEAACDELERQVPESRSITGNAAMAGFTAPKLVWIRQHEPEAFDRIRCVLLPKDWLRLRMCGNKASDHSDSAGTLWMDVAARKWSDAMLAATGLDRATMPELFEGSEITGRLRPDIATGWGLARIPVAAGGGDNAAGAVGMGAISDGEGFVSLGTSGVIFVADDHFRAAPDRMVHAFCHALPGRWHRMGVTLSAASALDWAARSFGFGKTPALLAAVDADRMGEGPMMLPYLSGERTPHNRPALRAQIHGLGMEHGPDALAAAALEGVCHTLADAHRALGAANPLPDALSVIGGGSRSDLFCRTLASALDTRLERRDAASAGPAYGAARLARLCLGGETPTAVCAPPPIEAVFDPQPDLRDRLKSRARIFADLLPAATRASALLSRTAT